jgi:hypothetical protein
MRDISRNPPKDRDLLLKYLFCNRYFLENTFGRWKIRIADDTLVNFRKLGKFISLMEERHNPLTEFVFKAHCISRWGAYIYPQGGSGNLMSRFACNVAVTHTFDFLNYSDLLDDLAVGHYMTVEHRFPGVAIAGGPFSGHTPAEMRFLLASNSSKFSKVPSCRFRSRREWGCGDYVFRANDLVFLHLWPFAGMQDLFTFGRMLFNAPDDIFMWNKATGIMTLCRETDRFVLSLGGPSLFNTTRVKWANSSWY